MSSFTESRKQERLMKYVIGEEISERSYNLVMGLTIAYGLIVNVFMCAFCTDFAMDVIGSNYFMFLILYFGCCIAGTLISQKSDSPVISFLGYNLIVVPMGLIVAVAVKAYGGLGSAVVIQAFLYTLIIAFCMVGLSISFPNFFSKLGGVLAACLIGMIITEVIMLILGIHQEIFAWIGAVIFSLYIGYDYWKSQEYPKTVDNAVDSAIDIYVDIIALFLRILEILGNNRGRRR